MLSLLAMLAATAGPSPQLQQAIRSYFDLTMRDGPATRYIWLKSSRSDTNGIYCGRLNGKNAVGGYIGYVPYLVRHQGFRIIDSLVGDDPENRAAIETICNLEGFKVQPE